MASAPLFHAWKLIKSLSVLKKYELTFEMVISPRGMYKHDSLSLSLSFFFFLLVKIYQYGIFTWFISRKHTLSQRTFNSFPSGERKNIIDVIAYIVYVRDELTNKWTYMVIWNKSSSRTRRWTGKGWVEGRGLLLEEFKGKGESKLNVYTWYEYEHTLMMRAC